MRTVGSLNGGKIRGGVQRRSTVTTFLCVFWSCWKEIAACPWKGCSLADLSRTAWLIKRNWSVQAKCRHTPLQAVPLLMKSLQVRNLFDILWARDFDLWPFRPKKLSGTGLIELRTACMPSSVVELWCGHTQRQTARERIRQTERRLQEGINYLTTDLIGLQYGRPTTVPFCSLKWLFVIRQSFSYSVSVSKSTYDLVDLR